MSNTWYSLYLYTKFDDSSFSRSRNTCMLGTVPKNKRFRRPDHYPFGDGLLSKG